MYACTNSSGQFLYNYLIHLFWIETRMYINGRVQNGLLANSLNFLSKPVNMLSICAHTEGRKIPVHQTAIYIRRSLLFLVLIYI